jgi:TetR/AcrR family transcriptional regulator, transcriptional repressor for nem operon
MRDKVHTLGLLLEHAGVLFNHKGYKHTSLNDITKATGYTKGAIYRHFQNKETLEVAAFENLMAKVYSKLFSVIKAEKCAQTKLEAFINVFESYITNPIIAGGCPLLNVSVEADDLDPILREKAKLALLTLANSIRTIIENGIKFKQINPDIPIEDTITLVIASLEGGIMLSKLNGSDNHISIVCNFLKNNLLAPYYLKN